MKLPSRKKPDSDTKKSAVEVTVRVNRRGGLSVVDTGALLNSPQARELVEEAKKIRTTGS